MTFQKGPSTRGLDIHSRSITIRCRGHRRQCVDRQNHHVVEPGVHPVRPHADVARRDGVLLVRGVDSQTAVLVGRRVHPVQPYADPVAPDGHADLVPHAGSTRAISVCPDFGSGLVSSVQTVSVPDPSTRNSTRHDTLKPIPWSVAA